jgi:thiamine biosynthesis lipoprotein
MISLFILGCTVQKNQLQKIQGYALGTTYSISYVSNSLSSAILTQKVDSIFQVINQSLSTYQPDSDISKINRGDSLLVVDSHFITVYEKASEVWKYSQGFFDPTVGALVNAYGFGPGKSLEKVSKKQRDSMLEFTGWAKTQLTTKERFKRSIPPSTLILMHLQRAIL